MRTRLIKLGAALTALAALAVGGSALASAGQSSKAPSHKAKRDVKVAGHSSKAVKMVSPAAAPAASEQESGSPDTDNIQQGDQSTPDAADQQDGAAETAGTESESASESGPSDGPGGYADSSPSADTQQVGEN
jgi:hypothetical protein